MRGEIAPTLPPELILRVLAGIVADEHARQTRRSAPIGEVVGWGEMTRLDEDGVGLDSLMLLSAAQRVADYFALREVGYEDYLMTRRTLGDWTDIVARSLAVKHESLLFQTSGSTGPAQRRAHPVAELREEATTIARIAGPPLRVIGLVAPQHIYGFLHTILSAAAMGLPSVDLRAVEPGARVARLQRGDLVVGTPFIWSQIADSGEPFPDGVFGLTSTAPMSPELADRLAASGLSRMVEIYGSTETSGIGWRDDLRAPYELLPWWARSGNGLARFGGEEVAVPDVVEWEDDRRLRPLRRVDGAVQIAGVNVYPARVADAIKRHPSVKDCLVRRAGDKESTRLEAFVVVAEPLFDRESKAREIARHCNQELSAPERPAFIEVGSRLPLDAMGKPTAW